jgi:hypothetical protein
MRAAITTKDDGYRARLLRVATHAINSEIELLQRCGLLPHDLGTLRVRPETEDRIPSGLELQKLFDSVTVTPDELVSEAEIAMRYGDYSDYERASREGH